jgi:hypothetical protein
LDIPFVAIAIALATLAIALFVTVAINLAAAINALFDVVTIAVVLYF